VSYLTLDIETVPQARFTDPDRFASGDLDLDEDYLEEIHHEPEPLRFEIENGVAVLAATKAAAALHATTCHIVQVSFGWRAPMGNQPAELHRKVIQSDHWQNDDVDETGLALAARAEPEVVLAALDLLAGACQKGTTIVSFNGKQFDIPVLRARAALLHAKVPPVPWRRLLYPYADDRHADLRLILGADDRRARGTLQWWCDAFGIHAEEHGAEVFGWVRAGEWDKLRQYGCTEAQTLVELYEAVQGVL
jgi:hypothetical protein